MAVGHSEHFWRHTECYHTKNGKNCVTYYGNYSNQRNHCYNGNCSNHSRTNLTESGNHKAYNRVSVFLHACRYSLFYLFFIWASVSR